MKKLRNLASILVASVMVVVGIGCSTGAEPVSKEPTVSTNTDGSVTITIDDDQKGYISGTGKLGTGKTGWNATNDAFWENFGTDAGAANIKYCVNTNTAGDYKMTLRYCFGGWCDTLKDVIIFINGKQVLSHNPDNIFYLDYTVNKKWKSEEIPVTLDEGDNFIVIKCAVGKTREFAVPSVSGYSFSPAITNSKELKPGDIVTGTVTSMPNIDWISITSTVPGVKMAAGSSNATAYWSVSARSENDSTGTVTMSATGDSVTNGTEVTFTATPKPGYRFDCWHTGFTSNNPTEKVLVTKDIPAVARFIPDSYTNSDLEGYATICDDDGTTYTITGGFGGEEITISSYQDILDNKSKISGSEPYIIKFTKRISSAEWIDTAEYNDALSKLVEAKKSEDEAKFILKNRSFSFDIGSNKTVLGESGKGYGLININPKISGSNVIVKNLHFGDVIGDDYFGGSGNDAMSIKGGQHVWIDHCEFSSHLEPHDVDGNKLVVTQEGEDFVKLGDYKLPVDLEGENSTVGVKWAKDFYDGLLDISETSRFVTVSNSYFHDHWKACLCGGSNDKAETQPQGSQVRMTFFNNYFKDIHARQPLFRFGKAHIYSSYYKGVGDSTGIEVRAESEVYVDNCYFEDIRSDRTVGCWNSSKDLGPGTWTTKDNVGMANTNGTRYVPPYQWTKTSANDSKTNLQNTAGIVGKSK